MTDQLEFDVIVLGGGPGGYVAAIRAAQQNLKVALIEANQMGGTCLNRGCIPSKALIHYAKIWKQFKRSEDFGIHAENISFDFEKMESKKEDVVTQIRNSLEGLIKTNRIQIFQGFGKLESPHVVKVIGKDSAFLKGKFIILATGSEPRELPSIPFDYELIHDSTSFLNLKQLPKRLVIVGGGVIGCEFAAMHAAFGVEVTILEILPMIISLEGKQVSDVLTRSFTKKGIQVKTNIRIQSVEKTASEVTFTLEDGSSIVADCALVSVGREFNTEGIGLEKAGVIVKPNGSIDVNEHLQTNVDHIYAIGDITAKWILAHVASHQGVVAANHIVDQTSSIDYRSVPSVIFTDPEIATVGYTVEKAIEAGYDAVASQFPFQALGKAQAIQAPEGFAQLVTSKSTGQILGAQVIGHEASNLIAEIGLAIDNELTVEAVAHTIHAHPTIAEAWMEAAMLSMDKPVHFPPKPKVGV